jgi:DNA mismatch repair protein MutS
MFRQYHALKRDHPGAILLFRMGDFYEMFFEDAQEASRLLDLTLTARGKGTDNVAPMCGFPHHQLDAYTAKLVTRGRRVAVCEQTEDPRKAKGLVRREVVRIVTPGTVLDPGQLDPKDNAWIAGVAVAGGLLGAAFLDASTGDFLAWQAPQGEDGWEALSDRLAAFVPREIVFPEGFPWSEAFRAARAGDALLTECEPFGFTPGSAAERLTRQFGVASLDGFGLRDRPAAVAAAGGLLGYAQDTQRSALEHVEQVVTHEPSRALLLDPATRRNLEIERSLRHGGVEGSLFQSLDETVTAPGGRLLRRWLLAPLTEPAEIAARHDAVEELHAGERVRQALREALRAVHDVERLTARAVAGTAHPRDLAAVRASLRALPDLAGSLSVCRAALLRETVAAIDPLEDLAGVLEGGLADDPPAGARDGGVIRDGFHEELDQLRVLRGDGRATIAAIEGRERADTGIGSLKVRYNKVFGYYIEVSKANLHLVPDRFRRKQTIAGGERYVTDELQDYQDKVLHAQERIEALEYELFQTLRQEVAARAPRVKRTARAIAQLDVLASFAETAVRHGYCRPRVDGGTALRLRGARHPVVERTLPARAFVPNDTSLDAEGKAIAILTGPNMGGKSTYLRQVALVVLLAQAGSFVPAEEAVVGVADRIFCRVGASDSLAEGQSTFMVEMTETANILHHATARSLVLLDEIGRGTSTFDGLSIAWAVVEHLHGRTGGAPRTLFATHYHELTELAVQLQGVANCRMAVRERGDQVVFLHRVEDGAADRSYGIHVARLAGVPAAVVARAGEILLNLERDEFGGDGLPRRARKRGQAQKGQFALFPAEAQDAGAAEVLAELRTADPARLTPLEALTLLDAWRRRLRGEA